MRDKFLFLVSHSLKKKFTSKSFIITNIVLLVLLVGIINIQGIISFFGGDFDKDTNIYIIDNSVYNLEDKFKEIYDATNEATGMSFENIVFKETDKTSKELEEELVGTTDILIEIISNEESYISAKIVSEGYIDTMLNQVLTSSLNTIKYEIAITNSGIDPEELASVLTPITTERIILDENKKAEGESMEMIMSMLFPTLILPFYMLTLFLVQIIGGEINEEKQTRSMEVIISNVTPKTHFFSKILSANIFVVAQSILLVGYSGVGMFISKLLSTKSTTSGVTDALGGFDGVMDTLRSTGILDNIAITITLAVILLILSFLAYSLIAGILASMTVSIEDYQQIQTPIIMISVAAYMLAIMAGNFEGSVFIRVLSYIPLLSCLLCPALFIIGQVGIIDILIAVIVTVIFDWILIKYGMKIYKTGVLNYSTDKMWSRIFKAVKQ